MGEQGAQTTERVVLVPYPLQGHIRPMLDLGSALHSKGFSIIVVHTQFNSPNPSNYPEFTFFPIDIGLTDSDIYSIGPDAFISTLNTKSQDPLEEGLIKVMDHEGGVACIIYDAIMYAMDDVAEHLNLRRIVFHTCSVAAIAAFTELPRLKQEGYFLLEDSKLQDLVPRLDPLRQNDLPVINFMSIESQLEQAANLCNMRGASSVIWNSSDCLERLPLVEFQKKHQIPFFSVGPLCKTATASFSSLLKADENCITWLDKQNPNSVLYISLGSLVAIDEKEFAEMAWGLANCEQPFLWVVRPGSVRGSEWIELLPEGFMELISEKGIIVKWASQKEVLAHEAVGGFWTHCGWNSTLESIYEGVPMICSPKFGDQNVNARYVSHVWRVGLELGGEAERGEIQEVVKRLMIEDEGKQVRKRATDLKEKVKLTTLEGGSSYNSLNNLAKYIFSVLTVKEQSSVIVA